MEKYIAIALVVFVIASHALTFASDVLKALNKDKPGWLDTASNAVAKILDLLNGQKKAQ